MPIKRFGSTLVSRGEFDSYMQLLRSAHSEENMASVMCRSLISVDWQGYLYDCDFNQMLGLHMQSNGPGKIHISELASMNVAGQAIHVADHCFGCTAGQGSGCSGALTG